MARQKDKQLPPYNPLDKENLGVSVADALLEQLPNPLFSIEKFLGAGIYALYYVGSFPAYQPISMRNVRDQFEAPIYVGKAVPEGARKGEVGIGTEPGPVLIRRLKEHAKSIGEVENLDVEDFFCRYLVVEDIWIPLGESLLIEKFRPIWNQVIEGFGIHTPGKGRKDQQRSKWDMIHSGRNFAAKHPPNEKSRDSIFEEIRHHLTSFQIH